MKIVMKFSRGLSWSVFVIAGVTVACFVSYRPAAIVAALAVQPGKTPDTEVRTPPPRLSETGLYDAGARIDPRNLPFVPQYPLWSDGAAKSRWIFLPEGSKVNVSDVDVWRFPSGTKFWKEFAWGGRKVETRMIWKASDDDWVFATYAWTEDQSDALLAPENGIRNVVALARGKSHSIPGTVDCRTCHESSPSVVLGFNSLQLSDDRDPLAPHAEPLVPGAVTLRALIKADRLHPPRPNLATHPPRIRESNPAARAALGYLSANCGGCHNDSGPLARLGLVLLHDSARDSGGSMSELEPAHRTAIDAASNYIPPGVPEESARIVAPGAPDRSVLLHRMRSRRPSSQMPPLGTSIADEEAAELVQLWIESLKTRTRP